MTARTTPRGAPGRILTLAIALAAAAVALGVCGCKKGKKKVKIGFCMTLDHPYWNNMKLGAEDEARRLGAEVTIKNAEEDAGKQIQQIQELIASGVDILCVVPMKVDAAVPGVQEANREKVPVIIVNREIGPGCEYVCYTGTSTYEGAVTSAKILMEAISQVAVIRGRLGGLQRNQIETNINSQRVALENVMAAESAIRDADIAVEVAALTRAQILVQSTTSVLGVANQLPQNVLALLG